MAVVLRQYVCGGPPGWNVAADVRKPIVTMPQRQNGWDMGKKLKNPIHGLKHKCFFERKWFSETVAAAPPFVAAAIAAFKTAADGMGWIFWLAIASCVWLVGAGMLKVFLGKKQDAAEDEARSHDGLLAALHVLHATVAQAGKLTPEEKNRCLRVTFHRVVPPLDNSDKIEQIVPYVGGNHDGAGRTFYIRTGITGKAIRENSTLIMDRQSESFEDYKKQLISDWGYTQRDAEKFTSDRFSLMAVPVTDRDGQEVLGVVYLDCCNRNFFASEAVKIAVLSCCAGVARYTGERYV